MTTEFHALVASTVGDYYATLSTYRSREDFYRRVSASSEGGPLWGELIELFPSRDDALRAADELNRIAGFTR
jgi:hypothetical protein